MVIIIYPIGDSGEDIDVAVVVVDADVDGVPELVVDVVVVRNAPVTCVRTIAD